MLLDNFRAKLRKEAQLWRDAGIINDVQYQQLTQYNQANLEEPVVLQRNAKTATALLSILIVTVAITFFAATEQALTREIKVLLLLSLLAASNITGFYLWQQPIKAQLEGTKPVRRKHTLGQSLLILSALLLGVNLSVVAQLFHINQANYELLLLWGAGVTLMAYSYKEQKLAIFGLVIVLVSYLTSLSELPYLNDVSWSVIIVEHMPLLLWVVFVPLAIWCRSRISFTLTAIAFTLTLLLNIKPLQYLNATNNFSYLAAFAFILPPALLWSYDDLLFPKVSKRYFQQVARNLALICLWIFFYILGFKSYWQAPSLTLSHINPVNLELHTSIIIDIAFLSLIAVIQWLFMIQQKFSWNNLIILTGIAICGLAPFFYYLNIDVPSAPTILFNALFIIFALLLIRHALHTREHKEFWGGILMLTLLIVTRMYEYQTDLLLASLILTLYSIAVIGTVVVVRQR
ncbi:hypothetical protein NIES4071_65140 [Calothrix sp. NIES-4071]|nr:hypothetical protein NIES4071_65140 [Calothrix sp. NIES-4071]BAZ60818.1 hypothetical protein NIES4105_65100 [Calothrix sp. NIES-4105]